MKEIEKQGFMIPDYYLKIRKKLTEVK